MTLAAIVLVGILGASAQPLRAAVWRAQFQAAQSQASQSPSDQNQGSQKPSQPPAPAPAKPPATHAAPSTAARSHHKKRVLPVNCDPTPASSGPASPSGTAQTSGDTATTGTAATAKNPSPCPPTKVVVRQGGSTEPSIQLAPSPTGQTAQPDASKEMLEATEANLKKIAGRQLSTDQQDVVNQIHQFMDQSKSFVTAGDLDRARTLAWKAQLLSEDLVKAEK